MWYGITDTCVFHCFRYTDYFDRQFVEWLHLSVYGFVCVCGGVWSIDLVNVHVLCENLSAPFHNGHHFNTRPAKCEFKTVEHWEINCTNGDTSITIAMGSESDPLHCSVLQIAADNQWVTLLVIGEYPMDRVVAHWMYHGTRGAIDMSLVMNRKEISFQRFAGDWPWITLTDLPNYRIKIILLMLSSKLSFAMMSAKTSWWHRLSPSPKVYHTPSMGGYHPWSNGWPNISGSFTRHIISNKRRREEIPRTQLSYNWVSIIEVYCLFIS